MAAVVSGRQTANQKEYGREGRESEGTRPLPRTRGAPTRQGIMGLMKLMGVMLALGKLSQARTPPIGRYIYRQMASSVNTRVEGRGTRTTTKAIVVQHSHGRDL
jgi:hypothetical protein